MTNNIKQDISKTQVHHLGFLFWYKWILSFIWPIKLINVGADDTYLELVLFRGKTLLNSRHANYSNGNLQEAFKQCFKEINLGLDSRQTALVLGFGLGGVSQLLHEKNNAIKQTGVEIDATVLKWYRMYCKEVPKVNVVQADAIEYVRDLDGLFDIIIVDVYRDLDVPEELHSKSMLRKLSTLLTSQGVLVFNKVVANGAHKDQVNQLIIDLSSLFKSVKVNNQFDLNHFIICQNETQ